MLENSRPKWLKPREVQIRPDLGDAAVLLVSFGGGAWLFWLWDNPYSSSWMLRLAVVTAPLASGALMWAVAAWVKLNNVRRVALMVTLWSLGAYEIAFALLMLLSLLLNEGIFLTLLAGFIFAEIARQTLLRRVDFQKEGLGWFAALFLGIYWFNFFCAAQGNTMRYMKGGSTLLWNPWQMFWLIVCAVIFAPALFLDIRYKRFASEMARKGYPDASGHDFYQLWREFGPEVVRRIPAWDDLLETIPGSASRSRVEVVEDILRQGASRPRVISGPGA
jgi:hypothetical protein